jgi:hypothetical protein
VVTHSSRDAALSIFEIPNWAVQLVVLLVLVGFPIAIVLSSAFEITPQRIKREGQINHRKSIARRTAAKFSSKRIDRFRFAEQAGGKFNQQKNP